MNRREMLKALLVAPLVPVLPLLPQRPKFTQSFAFCGGNLIDHEAIYSFPDKERNYLERYAAEDVKVSQVLSEHGKVIVERRHV